MEDKVILNEFAAKVSKAKILYDAASSHCEKLKKQAGQLLREYETLRSQRLSAEAMEQSLNKQLEFTRELNREQTQKHDKQVHQLAELRRNRKQLKREKDLLQNQLLKNTLSLEQEIQERERLQQTAKMLSDRLQGVTAEKEVLLNQYNNSCSTIEEYNKNIEALRTEIQDMKSVISSNTVPVCKSSI